MLTTMFAVAQKDHAMAGSERIQGGASLGRWWRTKDVILLPCAAAP